MLELTHLTNSPPPTRKSAEVIIPYLYIQAQRTLHRRLSASSRNSAHSSNHEVLEQQIRVRAALIEVGTEVRDLSRASLALERAGVRPAVRGVVSLRRRAEGPGRGGTGARLGHSSRQRARCDREGRHRGLCGFNWVSVVGVERRGRVW